MEIADALWSAGDLRRVSAQPMVAVKRWISEIDKETWLDWICDGMAGIMDRW